MRETLYAAVFRHRGVLLLALSIPITVTALRGGGLVPGQVLSGTAIAASGVSLRLWAARQIGRGARVYRPGASQGIIASGPYRWTRNPLYLAAALMLGGLALVAGNAWLAAALIPLTVIAYTPVVLVEESALRALPGDDYRRYLASVPRWIGIPPRTSAAGDGAAKVDWREVFRRERGLVPWMLVALISIAVMRGEWIPIASLSQRLDQAVGCGLIAIVIAGMVVAIAAVVFDVELRTRRRSAARAARRTQA